MRRRGTARRRAPRAHLRARRGRRRAGRAEWHGDRWSIDATRRPAPSTLTLHVAGGHNVTNALAATRRRARRRRPLDAIGRGLEASRRCAAARRARRIRGGGVAATLVDDSYNANPDSARAAIDVLASMPAPRWLVLGDMVEVGDQGPAFHREVGAHARARGIDALWTAARRARTGRGVRRGTPFQRCASLVAALAEAPACASCWSRARASCSMEHVVAALEGKAAGDAHAA